MDLRRLRYFVTVAEERHVGRAAQRLHMSQPPLSRSVRELEDELGCELFVRGPRGVRLTAAGEVLLEEARALLDRAERAKHRVAQQAGGARTLRIGVLGPGEAVLSAPAAAVFGRRHPDAEVGLHQGDLADPTMGLADGRIDVAVTWTPFDETGLVTRTLRTDRCYVAVADADPLAASDPPTRAELRGRPAVRLPTGADSAWRAYWQVDADGPGPVVRSLDECLHAVLWQRSLALVPALAVRRHAVEGIAYRPVRDIAPSRLVLAWRRGERSPLVAAYVAAFAAIATAARRTADPTGGTPAG
jgi:DNA-binding transcriptional LysR family regulator